MMSPWCLCSISLTIEPGLTLGPVGKSGSGETMLALTEPEGISMRGSKIGFIFQEPMTALNSAMRTACKLPKRCASPKLTR